MIKEVKITADTIEEAQQQAKMQLRSENIQFEVIQHPEKKKLFFGGKPAIVRAYTELTPLDCAKDYLSEILDKLGIKDFEMTDRKSVV